MAKEQKRTNREARKPKQVKVPAAVASPFGSAGKAVPAGKGK